MTTRPKPDSPQIASLRAHVKAAQEEFDLAVVFHEVWKPAAYDEDLHKRLGVSYATNAFRVVVTALRREMLLAMMRLWDSSKGAVRMERIAKIIGDKHIIDTLAVDRASRFNDIHIEAEMKEDLRGKAQEVIDLIKSYSTGGANNAILEKLRTVRHERLAHRQIEPTAATGPGLPDTDVESFYQDNSKIIGRLLSLVSAVHYEPGETGEVFRHHASFFWSAVRGERTEGHPNYRPPPGPVR